MRLQIRSRNKFSCLSIIGAEGMDHTHLKEMTNRLLEYNRSAAAFFLQCRKTGVQGDFYSEVKPFADKVKVLAEEWQTEAIDWINLTKPKNLYPLQIKNTTENLQMVAIRAFFPETSLKRFQSHVQSIEYVLERILEGLKENKSCGK